MTSGRQDDATGRWAALARELEEAARQAGAMAMGYFREGATTSAAIRTKQGGSPVTDADMLLDGWLEKRLRAAMPHAAWLSEESVDDPLRLDHDEVIIVDPIDGTRAFMSGDRRWAVALAYVTQGQAVAGVVHLPALGQTYVAHRGGGARLNDATIAVSPAAHWRELTLGGPSELSEALRAAGSGIAIEPRVPSLAYRLARVASGHIDAAFAGPNANDWDIAAADIILSEAGGLLTSIDGERPAYNRPRPRHAALVATPAPLHDEALAAMRAARQRLRR